VIVLGPNSMLSRHFDATTIKCRPNGTFHVTVLARRAVSAAQPPTLQAACSVTDDDRRRQQTTDASEPNNTGPLSGPVINNIIDLIFIAVLIRQ